MGLRQGGWRYRGEGCACSAYGDAEDHPGRVLLVSKKSDLVEGRGALSDEEAEAARRLDAEIWTRTERPERFSAELTHIERRDWFTKQVLLPLLSHTGALAAGDLVRLRTVGFRPDGDEVGLLLPDALAVGHLCSRAGVPGVGYFGSTVAFEIKPKSAAVPGGRALIPPRQSYKRTHSEFQLMQHYKVRGRGWQAWLWRSALTNSTIFSSPSRPGLSARQGKDGDGFFVRAFGPPRPGLEARGPPGPLPVPSEQPRGVHRVAQGLPRGLLARGPRG